MFWVLKESIMKKIVLVISGVLLSSMLFSQVDSYTIEASKTYEDHTKTVYLNLVGVLDGDLAKQIEATLEAQSDIHKFSFYANPDFKKCMFTANTSVDVDEIIALINETVYDANPPEGSQIVFANQAQYENYFKAVFDLDRQPDDEVIKYIQNTLKESDFISDVNYKGNAHFEIFAYEPLYVERVNQLLQQFDVEISESSLKQK